MLDFRVLTFLCVCKHMNYTKAANELGLTQPAISQHIKYLEDYYQAKLFEYQNRKLTLTEQGTFLKQTMETFALDALRVKDEISKMDSLHSIRIGATMSIGDYYLPDRLSTFMRNHSDINLVVTVDDTTNLLAQLDKGELDFILCEGYFDRTIYNSSLIRRESMCALCSETYPLPARIKGIEDLLAENLLLREKGSGTRDIFERKLNEKGLPIEAFTKHSIFNSTELILKLLLASQGISFLYESVAMDLINLGVLKKISIPNFTLAHEFNVVWKKGSLFEDKYHLYIEEFI